MTKHNRYGLARNIPAATKRAVRQACGFGCVICGTPFIEYHHADTAFVDTAEHDATKLTLLCGTCHGRVSRGTYSDEKVREHMARPYCLEHGPKFVDLDYGGKDAPRVKIGNMEFDNCLVPVRIEDYALISLGRPPEAGAPVLISAFFPNTQDLRGDSAQRSAIQSPKLGHHGRGHSRPHMGRPGASLFNA